MMVGHFLSFPFHDVKPQLPNKLDGVECRQAVVFSLAVWQGSEGHQARVMLLGAVPLLSIQRKYTILMGDFWLEFVLLEEGLYLLCGRRQKTYFSESFVSDTPYYIILWG